MPDDASLKRRLMALAAASERSAFERVRAVFPEIEAAIDAGASRADIVAALKAEGVEIAPKIFTNYVQRLRALKNKPGALPAPSEPVRDPPRAPKRAGQ